jgi:NADPH-dependent F420 reductase
MKIGIVGGTGGMGEGFALRWVLNHDIIVGSRDKERASNTAQTYMKTASSVYGDSVKGTITGDDNLALVKDSDVIILSIPYDSIEFTCTSISNQLKNGSIVVSPIVPMDRTDAGFTFAPFEKHLKSAGQAVIDNLPQGTKVVSAFHTIAEMKLKNAPQSLDSDTFVCGDDMDDVTKINSLISEINGLRAIYLGPMKLSYQAEILTPMLLNASKRNKIKHPGIKII